MRTKCTFSFIIFVLLSVSLFSQTSGTKKWDYLTDFPILSSPAIGIDGTIYIVSMRNLHAIAPDGTQKWEFLLGDNMGTSSPAIGSDGTIYACSLGQYLYAINPDGTQKWKYYNYLYPIQSSPAIGVDGTIYFGSPGGTLKAINPDGTVKWEIGNIIQPDTPPALGVDGTIYIGSVYGYFYAINPDGTLKWIYTTGSQIWGAPAIGCDGTIYIGSFDNKLHAITSTGTKKWEFLTGGYVRSSPSISSDGTIYIGSYDKNLYAINPDGTKKWEFITGGVVSSSPLIGSDGTIYVGSEDNKVYAVNPDGSNKWEFLTGDVVSSSPAIGFDGTIYIGSNDMKLYALFSSGGGLAKSPWPKYRHDNFGKSRFTDLIVINNNFSNIVSPDQSYTFDLNLFSTYNGNVAISQISFNDASFRFSSSLPITVVPGIKKEINISLTEPQKKWYRPTLSIDYSVEGSNIAKTFALDGVIFSDDSSELAHTANQVMPVWKSLDRSNEVLLNNTKGVIYRLLSDYNAADSCFDIAVSRALNARYGYAGIMMNIGVVKSDQVIPDSANVFYTDALKDIQATAATSALAPQVYYNQAWEAYKKTNYTDAAGLATQTINHAKTNAYLKA
ncbi:MAG: PQQ-binding-like beta-propeller repeat protein [Bacteroidia bacterium]|nr:PQQ-binding-like beta-propeller repeat protein [Bacteroidia bacterium]